MARESLLQAGIHPRIVEFVETQLGPETDGRVQDDIDYIQGYIGAAAGIQYVAVVARIDGAKNEIEDSLCAEIGFWRAVADFNRSQQDLRTSEQKPKHS